MKRLWLAVLMVGAVAAAPAQQADVVVRKLPGEKSSIDLSGFTTGGASAAFAKIMQNDLVRSGWFVLAPAGRGEFRVGGGAADEGGRLTAKCAAVNSGSGAAVVSKSYGASSAQLRALAHKISDDIVKAVSRHEGFASSRLALIGRRTGQKELYLCDSDGANMTQVTQDRCACLKPRWSPDNSKITYTSFVKGYADAYLIEVASGARRRLAGFPGLNMGAAISPDGRSAALVLSRDGNPELYVMNLAGGGMTRLTQTPKAGESSPSWSPDGSQLVYVSDQSGKPQLYLIARSGGAPRRLTTRGFENVAPDWGPGGLIAYASQVGGHFQLCTIDPKTGEPATVAADAADYEDPSWARDGRHLACGRTAGYKSSICLVDIMGGEKVALLDDQGDWFSPAWSR